jgi:hypothetical protein
MIKQWLTIFTFLSLTFSAYSQDVSVVAQAPQVVEVGEQFEIQFVVNNKPSNFIVPDIKDFQLLGGPSTSTSSSMSWINGKVTQSMAITYSYYYQSSKPGKYLIGAAEATVNGKKYKSNPINIEVVASNNRKGQSNQNQNQNPNRQSGGSSNNAGAETVSANNEDIFLRLYVDKKDVSVGEYISASVKIYTKYDISQLSNFNPSLNGFYMQQVEIPKQSLQKETVNGQVYFSATLGKYILFPQKSGKIHIDPLTLDCIIQKTVKSRGRGFFDDFFADVREVPVKLKSLPVDINVRALPENKPESFNGAVGKFTFDAKVDKNAVKANDAITLKVTINGTGNIKLIDAPKINFPPDFEVYDPKVNESTTASSGNISGTKTFEYLIVPRNPGKFKIDPITFSYFDLASKQYKTLSSGDFNFDIAKGDDNQAATVVSGLSKEDVKFVGKDILFIKADPGKLQSINNIFFGTPAFYLIYIIGILIFIIVIILRRRIIIQNSNKALVRNRKADKFATKRLKQAKIHLEANEKEKFYEEVIKGIWGYLADKLNIATKDLSKDNARELLLKHNVDEDTIQQFLTLTDNCEFARYAPVSGENALADDYQKAINLITKLQQKLK